MSDDNTTLDPAIQRELDALDASLAGRPVDAELNEVAELATQLRAEREEPSARFVSELDARAAAGFPGAWRPRPESRVAGLSRRSADRLRSAGLRRRLMPALAGAATMIVVGTAVVVSIGGDGGEERQTATALSDGGNATAPAGAPLQQKDLPELQQKDLPPLEKDSMTSPGSGIEPGRVGVLPSTTTVPPQLGPGGAPGVRNRRVERSAELTLGTDAADLRDVTSKAFEVIGRHRGIVLRSSVDEGEEGQASASFELLIPSGRLSPALADLSALAEVRSRRENTLDITAPFVSAREHLRDARAEAEGLLRELGRADTASERASVKAQLQIVRGRIAAFRSQADRLQRRSSFSRVSLVVLTGDEVSAVPGAEDGQWTIGDALGDAGRILAVMAGIAVVSLALALPLALLAGAALATRRRYLRRAREQALGT